MAMVQCHYEINVAKGEIRGANGERRYVHLFATDERSCVTERDMQDVYRELVSKFPWPEYHVQVTEIQCSGRKIWTSTVL